MIQFEIEWKGPFSLEEISSLNTSIDYGIYQIYGTHNISGTDALLYVGQACDQTFSQRIPQREYISWEFPEYRIYIGRLGGSAVLSEEEWNKQISISEQILIDYCQPPYNSQLLNGLSASINNEINVLNFGKRHKLPFAITTSWRGSNHHKGIWKAFSNTHHIS